jgi:dephospho-CoA kinase
MTRRIGLTGPIAGGKTTAAHFFALAGFPVWDADKAVSEIYTHHAAHILQPIYPEALSAQGVDREKLRQRIKEKPSTLEQLEEALKPWLIQHRETWQSHHIHAPWVVWDVPLLFERGLEKDVDVRITVWAPLEVLLARASQRPHFNKESFVQLLDRQKPWSDKIKQSHFHLATHHDLAYTQRRVHDWIRALCT